GKPPRRADAAAGRGRRGFARRARPRASRRRAEAGLFRPGPSPAARSGRAGHGSRGDRPVGAGLRLGAVSRASGIAALGVLLILLAGALAVSPLYVPGIALVVLALAAETSVRVASRHGSVALELASSEIEEGLPVEVRVRAAGWPFALCRGELEPLPGSEPRPVQFRGFAQELALRPARRGEHTVGPATVRLGD